jgi:5-methylthioadenosine/S-adenosylhomocysteine deaminase
MGILLKNGLIITQNSNRDVFSGDILIQGNHISKIGIDLPEGNHEVLHLDRMVVSPGFVQSHVHLCQTLFRNLSDDLELLDWLENHIWPMENAHNEDSLRISARLGLAEMLLSGTTAILDMGNGNFQDIIFQEMASSGIRGLSGMVMMDMGDQPYKRKTADILQDSEALINKWHNTHDGRIHYALAPRFVPSCSMELWNGVKKLSDDYQLIIHTHSSENRTEWKIVKNQTGYSNVEFFVRKHLASPRLCLAHCIWLEKQEFGMLSDYGINVLHCPSANLKLGSGIAPIPEFIKRKINVSLGSDGAACNNNLDIFHEMRLAALIQKPHAGVKATPALTVFDMATLGGSRSLGLQEYIGSLEEGKKADLVILNLNKVHSIPADDIYSQIVYSGKAADVVHVMINGKWIVSEGQLNTIDHDTLISQSWYEVQELFKRQNN